MNNPSLTTRPVQDGFIHFLSSACIGVPDWWRLGVFLSAGARHSHGGGRFARPVVNALFKIAQEFSINRYAAGRSSAETWKAHCVRKEFVMLNNEEGKIGWILLWALGVPIPILLVIFVMRGCT